MNVDTLPTWTERIAKAVASWKGEVSFSPDLMDSLPLEIRMDRVFKDAGVRDLVLRVQELEQAVLILWPLANSTRNRTEQEHDRLDDLVPLIKDLRRRTIDVEDMPENVVND